MLALSLVVLAAAPLPDTFAKVDPAVVTVRVAMHREEANDSHVLTEMSLGLGSGVLVQRDGYIVTAAHVVERAEIIEVHFAWGQKSVAQVVTLSHTEDLALLKTAEAPNKPVTPPPLGDSAALKVGERLFAIGAPMGLEHTLTAGVLSALRTNDSHRLGPKTMLQTDVPINQGNSGGPLFNEAGEVVGIVSRIATFSGGSMGLGFAVPSNAVKERLFMHPLPYIGLSLRFIPHDVAVLFHWPVPAGFLVEYVKPGSPADNAGLKGGDIDATIGGTDVMLGGDLLVRVNGADASAPDKVGEVLRPLKAGDTIHYVVLREGEPMPIDVTVPALPPIPVLPKR